MTEWKVGDRAYVEAEVDATAHGHLYGRLGDNCYGSVPLRRLLRPLPTAMTAPEAALVESAITLRKTVWGGSPELYGTSSSGWFFVACVDVVIAERAVPGPVAVGMSAYKSS